MYSNLTALIKPAQGSKPHWSKSRRSERVKTRTVCKLYKLNYCQLLRSVI